jgi:hypothetical protein
VAEKIRGDGKCDSDDTWLEESRPKLGH